MNQSDKILSQLAERFPGLTDGQEAVLGADVVEFLGQFRNELSAIAERGQQTGRRKALLKQEYVAQGTHTFVDRHTVTDPHVAASKYLSATGSCPASCTGRASMRGCSASARSAGRAAGGGRLRVSTHRTARRSRRGPRDRKRVLGEARTVTVLEKILRSEMAKTSFPDEPGREDLRTSGDRRSNQPR